MAKIIDQDARPGLKRFRMVVRKFRTGETATKKGPPKLKIRPSGYSEVNVPGTTIFDDMARAAGLDQNAYGIVFGGDEAEGHLAAVVVELDTTGATPVRRDPTRNNITIYLDDFFTDFPALRPSRTRRCDIKVEPDGAGGSYALITLNAGLDHRSVRRTPAPVPVAK